MDPGETTKWPYMFVIDGDGRATEWLVLHAPIQSASRRVMFAEYRRRGLGFVGMTSFMTYPAPDGADPLDYIAVCEGWCHCFRDPDRFLPQTVPRVELALSDFTDPEWVSPQRIAPLAADMPTFDFVYVGDRRPWKMTAKNWRLARACLPELCDRLRLRGLLLGVAADDALRHPRVTVWPWLPWPRFLAVLARSRCLFLPNELDASPRVLAEALCLDVPVVVNEAIVGGHRYVTARTGTFFTGVEDVAASVAACLDLSVAPRDWFQRHSGPAWASDRLRSLLCQVRPSFAAPGPLRLSYRSGSLVTAPG